jgi:hypothetical protein
MSDAPVPPAAPAPPRSRSRRWLWFFALLLVLATGGITAEVWFNLRQQLTPEKLAEARRRWQEHGPRDYVLEYAVKHEYNPDVVTLPPERAYVEVEGGKVKSVVLVGGGTAHSGEFKFGSMDDLFDWIEQRLQADLQAEGRRPFVKATFGKDDGHLAHYVRSVMRTRERLAISVQLRRE